MKVVHFHKHAPPYVAGERAGFNDAVAERFERMGVGKIVPVAPMPVGTDRPDAGPAAKPIVGQAKVVRTAPRKG